jgi:hypothetical protein
MAAAFGVVIVAFSAISVSASEAVDFSIADKG